MSRDRLIEEASKLFDITSGVAEGIYKYILSLESKYIKWEGKEIELMSTIETKYPSDYEIGLKLYKKMCRD